MPRKVTLETSTVKDCGTKLSSGKTIAKTDHIWDSGKITKTATCKESGTKTYTCTSCNTTKTEEIPATGNHQNTELRNVKKQRVPRKVTRETPIVKTAEKNFLQAKQSPKQTTSGTLEE